MFSLWRLLLSVLPNCAIKLEWPGEMCYTNTTALIENSVFVLPSHSPFKFPEVCNYPQKTFPDKAYSALVFRTMRLILFFFFSLNLDDYFHSAPGWCRKASHEPHTCSQSLLICFFFLSLSWILDLTCQFHICISPFLCVNCTSLSTGLHFLLQAAWTLTSHPVFSCTFSSGLISYIYLAENL